LSSAPPLRPPAFRYTAAPSGHSAGGATAMAPPSLRPGHVRQMLLCTVAAVLGAVLLVLGSLLIGQRARPTASCGPEAEGAVESAAAWVGNVDLMLLALGVPIVVSGVSLLALPLRGALVALQLKRTPAARPRPCARPTLAATSASSLGLWIYLFISFFAAPVFKELCNDYSCGLAWPGGEHAVVPGLECYGAHPELKATCSHPEVCCGCRTSWSGGGEPELLCRQTKTWACESETLEAVISYVVCVLALGLAASAVGLHCIVRGRCRNVIDGDVCEAAAEIGTAQGPEAGKLGPSPGEEPASPRGGRSRGGQPADGGGPGGGGRRASPGAPLAGELNPKEPPVVVQYEFSV